MKTVKKVRTGLQSFLTEIGRWSKTSGFHYEVKFRENSVEIIHHNNKWLTRVSKKRIIIYTDDDVLTITRDAMMLNGEEVDEICDFQCYSREEIINKVILAILLYSCQTPQWLRTWVR